ncbi:hypothetical protein [Embleya hyalina]|uniref:Uncharacterized protein n=1 Tax=Embleya hyalina TaxID=516124 RepID=A0A401YLP2_9ACTN|nr:hypothetical protein [Embleya hyalina]GCD95530.1 hypothetical protein EHYA_03204 [Embleya hyalina]
MGSRHESRAGTKARTVTPTPDAVKDRAADHGAAPGHRARRGAPALGAAAAGVALLLWKRTRTRSRRHGR